MISPVWNDFTLVGSDLAGCALSLALGLVVVVLGVISPVCFAEELVGCDEGDGEFCEVGV